MDIIHELAVSVDRERGGGLATNLLELYDYMLRQLQVAYFEQVEEPLAEAERLLMTLEEAWDQIAAEPAAEPLTGAVHTESLDEFAYSARSFVY